MTETTRTETFGERLDRVREKLAAFQAKHPDKTIWVVAAPDNEFVQAGITSLDGCQFWIDEGITLISPAHGRERDIEIKGGQIYFSAGHPFPEIVDGDEGGDGDDWDDWEDEEDEPDVTTSGGR